MLLGINLEEHHLKEQLQGIINVTWVAFPIKYFGLPLSNRGTKTKDWNCIVNKFENKLQSWKSNMLYAGERWLLPKTVLQSLPSYFFSILGVPKCICHKLKSIRTTFFWKGNFVNKGLYLIDWQYVCRSIKTSDVITDSLVFKKEYYTTGSYFTLLLLSNWGTAKGLIFGRTTGLVTPHWLPRFLLFLGCALIL